MSAISLDRPRFVQTPAPRLVAVPRPSASGRPVRPAAPSIAPTIAKSAPRARGERARLRITSRGRAVLATLVALPIAFGAVAVGVGQQAAAQSAPVPVSFDYVTVQPGQSLWSIADRVAPASDPREVVARIVDLNQLPSAEVQAGQRLAVPSAR